MEHYPPKAAQTAPASPVRPRARAKKMAVALHECDARYRALYDENPSIYFTVDPAGMVLSVNQYGAAYLGYSVRDLAGKSVLTVFHEDDRAAVRSHLEACLTHPGKVHQWELRKIRKDGTEIWVKETARSIHISGSEPIVLIVCEDITQRRLAEEALRRYECMVSVSHDMMAFLDRNLRHLAVNSSYAKAFGRPAVAVVGLHLSEVVGTDVFESTIKPLIDRSLSGEKMNYQQWMQLPKCGLRYFDMHFNPFADSDKEVSGVVLEIRDLTEHKRTETTLQQYQEQLRNLAAEMSLAEERERRRIAVELHDRIVQSLALSQIKLGALRKALGSTAQADEANAIQILVDQVIRDTRTLVFELSPPILYELGFEPAIEWLGERLQEQHGIACRVESDEQVKQLDRDLQVVLFQAVRELLVNVAKHANARQASIRLWKEDTSVSVQVEDDGVGFDVSVIAHSAVERRGFGLFSIHERLSMSGGRLEIDSTPGKGTRVSLTAPLSSEMGV